MARMKLYHLPGACSRVTLTALEQVGASYEDEIVDLSKGAQHSPAYRAINPDGKIPALVVDGKLLTQNAAILWWLHRAHPDARLFPATDCPWDAARQVADLSAMASGWHPAVRANMMPVRFTTGDPQEVRAQGKALMRPILAAFDARVQGQPWWYGEDWSIIDTYAYWCYTTAEEGQFDLTGLAGIADHRQRVADHPAFRKAIERERKARERIN